jgi:hypothetical protein
VLWDLRYSRAITTTMLLFSVCQKPTSLTLGRAIRKFDRLTNYGSDVFNPAGREVVSHQQVYVRPSCCHLPPNAGYTLA